MNNKEKFKKYAELLSEWSKKMNLVAPSTLPYIQTRHFDDSAQLTDVIPKDVNVIDLGSGAGFPGVVLAILGWNVVCIESIGKKVAFLKEVKEQLNLDNLVIYHGRVEEYITKNNYGDKTIFTARAFAPLIKILDYVKTTKLPLYLLKGKDVSSEIAKAKQKYKFEYELVPSKTGDGFIIIINYR